MMMLEVARVVSNFRGLKVVGRARSHTKTKAYTFFSKVKCGQGEQLYQD